MMNRVEQMPCVWLKIIVPYANVLRVSRQIPYLKWNVLRLGVVHPEHATTRQFVRSPLRARFVNVLNILLAILCAKVAAPKDNVPTVMAIALPIRFVAEVVVSTHVTMPAVPMPNAKLSIVNRFARVPSVSNLWVSRPKKAVPVLCHTAAPMLIVAVRCVTMASVVSSAVKRMTVRWVRNVCRMSV